MDYNLKDDVTLILAPVKLHFLLFYLCNCHVPERGDDKEHVCVAHLSPGAEAAAELAAGGAEEEGESLELHTQSAETTAGGSEPGEQLAPGGGAHLTSDLWLHLV